MKFLTLSILFISIIGQAAESDISKCEEAADREQCYATTIDAKLNLILRRIGHGHGVEGELQEVSFYWGKDCTKDIMGTGYLPKSLTASNLESARAACDKIAQDVSRFSSDGYVDSYKVGNNCKNPDPRPNKTDKVAISRLCLSGLAN
ncbi:MAG: hypothetical protein R3B54_10035 [Bdellovibrionota bacterium]